MRYIRDQQKTYLVIDDPLQHFLSNTFSTTVLATMSVVLREWAKKMSFACASTVQQSQGVLIVLRSIQPSDLVQFDSLIFQQRF